MTKTAKQIELLKQENKELREEVEQLKNQLELNTFVLKYGEDGLEVKIGNHAIHPIANVINEKYVVVRYVYYGTVVRIKSYLKRLFDLLYDATDYNIEVLLNNNLHIVFSIKFKFVDKIKVCNYIVNKEFQTLSEYPHVDATKGEEKDE